MPDHSKPGDSATGEADSSGGLLKAIRRLFDSGEADTSLRAQLEEAIDEHEDEQATGSDDAGKGDLSPLELTMLRNLLHFSEHDADDVAIPRGQIVAVSADASWEELVEPVCRARPLAAAGLSRYARRDHRHDARQGCVSLPRAR